MSEHKISFSFRSLEFLRYHSRMAVEPDTGKRYKRYYYPAVVFLWILTAIFVICYFSGNQEKCVYGYGVVTGSGAEVLLPVASGREIRPGMCGCFYPDSAEADDFGGICCVVKRIHPQVIVFSGTHSSAADPVIRELVENRTGSYKVEVEFIPDSSSASGYRWSRKAGKSCSVKSGISGRVVIDAGGGE